MAKINFQPLNDRVLIQRLNGDTKTAGGIIIPDSAKDKPLEGKVVAIGPGKTNTDGTTKKLTVKTNDRVLFSKYAETEVKIEGQEYILLREDDILGIWNK